jgi:tripartite-type tricarboxylate transporter receptor subunit TctC
MNRICRTIAAALLVFCSAAAAQSWPTKPIRAFIPFGAGSATDIVPRALFDGLSKELGQQIVVENRGGAGGTLGIGEVVRAAPDGYTILANSSAQTIAPWIVPNFPFDVTKDLSGVFMIGDSATVMIVPPSRGWKTIKDFIAAAKAKPGTINYGSAGLGTATHIAAERFRVAADIQATHIPYKGGAEALADIMGGRVDYYFCPISTALPMVRDGRVTALLVSTAKRSPELPEVPTPAEAGLKNAESSSWFAVFMPAKTPREIIDKFHDAAAKVMATPEMQERMKKLVINPLSMTPAELDAYAVKELADNGKIIKAAGIGQK